MKKNNQPKPFYIYGHNPAEEMLKTNPNLVKHLVVEESVQKETFNHYRKIAKDNKIPFNSVSTKYLKRQVGDVVHQGVALKIGSFPYVNIHDWLSTLSDDKKHFVIITDHIHDPYNLGAIIRSAAAFNASAIIIPNANQATVNGTVFKTSAGAILHIPIIQVSNVNYCLETLKENNFWIASADMEGKETLHNQTFDSNLAFVIGNEGKGVSRLVKENSDLVINIPINSNIESLNASVTAAILSYEFNKQNS